MKARRDPCPHLLVEVPSTVVDDEMLARIEGINRAGGTRSSILRGLVTGNLWIVFHAGKRPAKKFIRYAESKEMAALPAVGGMQ